VLVVATSAGVLELVPWTAPRFDAGSAVLLAGVPFATHPPMTSRPQPEPLAGARIPAGVYAVHLQFCNVLGTLGLALSDGSACCLVSGDGGAATKSTGPIKSTAADAATTPRVDALIGLWAPNPGLNPAPTSNSSSNTSGADTRRVCAAGVGQTRRSAPGRNTVVRHSGFFI
jgi:hypothetical protein